MKIKVTTTLSFLFLCITTSVFSQTTTSSITIEVKNITSNKGTILIGLYNAKTNFLKSPYKSAICTANTKGVIYTFKNVPEGTYAVSLFHDEDNNSKLNTFMKIPTEDYGTSNDAPAYFGPPRWEDAKFELGTQMITQKIKLH